MNLTACKAEVASVACVSDWSEWNGLVEQAPITDVYYHPAYAYAHEVAGHGESMALTFSSDDFRILVPLMLRPLMTLPFANDEAGFDCATPYGYGGLLHISGPEKPEEAHIEAFLSALREWCRDAGVVSCFIRLHPLLNQDRWFYRIEERQPGVCVHYRGQTAAIDLSQWDSASRRVSGLHRSIRLRLNGARRRLRVTWSGIDLSVFDALNLFRQLYEQRMADLNAAPHYYFPPAYYTALATGLGDRLHVALAWMEQELVGASLFLDDREFAHYHLSGTSEKGRRLGASSLLINAAAEWARNRGCKLLHLGGGVCGEDSVFEYKKSFGGPCSRYHTLHVIADEVRYQRLAECRFRSRFLPAPRVGFFPQYRA